MLAVTLALCRLIAWVSGTAPGAPEYVFVPDTERPVAISRENGKLLVILMGKLDKDGEFIQEGKVEGEVIRFGGPFVILNAIPSVTPRRVYEFRSGMLVPGHMRAVGNFIPEEGGKIIKFSDYKYSPFAPPIWNLPGRFVKKPAEPKK